MNTNKQLFSLGQVLSVTTGLLLVEDVGEVYEILNHMTQANLLTHQLPRAADTVRPDIYSQYPILAEVTEESLAGITRMDFEERFNPLRVQYGDSFALEPMDLQEEFSTPIGDLIEMRGGNTNGIVILGPDGD